MFLTVIIFVREIIDLITKKEKSKRGVKLLFLSTISVFLFLRLLCFVVPLPLRTQTLFIIYETSCKYFLLASYQSFSYWLSAAATPLFASFCQARAVLSVVLLAIFLVSICVSILLTYFSNVCFILYSFVISHVICLILNLSLF